MDLEFMYFVEFHHHLHQNGLPTSGGGKTVRAGPHPSHCHGRQTTATAGQVRAHITLRYLICDQNSGLKEECILLQLLPVPVHSFLDNKFTLLSLSAFSLMHLLIPTLYHMKYPADTSKTTCPFNLTERPKTVQLLLEFMLDVLLMPYG